MFTGIVQAVGRIERAQARTEGLRLVVDAAALDLADVAIGDSVAINGCCLTVIERQDRRLAFDVSQATLACTTGLDRAGPVNLEKALRAGDRLGGHLMAGHVDGVGLVRSFESVGAASADRSMTLAIEAPAELVFDAVERNGPDLRIVARFLRPGAR